MQKPSKRPVPFDMRKRDGWQKQEERLAKRLDGKRQKSSGAKRMHRGDVITGAGMLVEAKYTSKKSMSIQREWLEKISEEAGLCGMSPVVSIEFEGIKSGVDRDWVFIPVRTFRRLLEEAGANKWS